MASRVRPSSTATSPGVACRSTRAAVTTTGRSSAPTPSRSSSTAMSGSASASIQWWGSRLRLAYSRSAIEAGVYTDPMICKVSPATSCRAARRAMNASRTVSLSRTSLSTRLRKTSAGTTTTSPASTTLAVRYGRCRVTRLTSPRKPRGPWRTMSSPPGPRISADAVRRTTQSYAASAGENSTSPACTDRRSPRVATIASWSSSSCGKPAPAECRLRHVDGRVGGVAINGTVSDSVDGAVSLAPAGRASRRGTSGRSRPGW